jgi:transmembrane protein 231
MKRIVVHENSLKKSYTASSRLAIAYIFVIACNIFTLVVPFYFWNGQFWKTQDSFREQPHVSFLYKVIMVLEAVSPTTGQQKEIFVSNLDAINMLRHETSRMANIQSHEADANLDGTNDYFDLEINVPLNPDEQIKRMQTIAFFDYQLKKRVKLEMESLAYVSVDSDLPLSGYDTEGEFMFRQTNPLGVRHYKSILYKDDTPLVRTDSPAAFHASNSNIRDILSRYRVRDVAADYVERYPIKSFDVGASSNGEKVYRLKMRIKVPTQDVGYIPTLIEVLKEAWVKYLSVVILCWLLFDRLKTFAFSHHLL